MDVMQMRRRLLVPQIRFVEYLEGTPRQQIINTGVAVNSADSAVEIEWMLINKTGTHVNYTPIFGNYIDENSGSFRLIMATEENRYYANSNQVAGAATTLTGVGINMKHTARLAHTVCYIDGNSISMRSGESYGNSNPLAIFAANIGGTNNNFTNYALRIYNFKIYSGNDIVANFHPCVKGTKPGMYDSVSNRFLTNIGIGEFTIPN